MSSQKDIVAQALPGYEILSQIGAGGMAAVYLCRHRAHGGFCALKILSPDLSREPLLGEAFLEEARTAAALHDHPNIIHIVDSGSSGGVIYLLMQFVQGEDVSNILKRRKSLTWQETAYVLQETTKALDWAHKRGVIHRDVKPSNIRLATDGRIVVLDFGIAKAGRTPTAITRMGSMAGTPAYMSPEQLAGERIDHRSDLYSLGVVAYQCLTGVQPFTASSLMEAWRLHREVIPDDVRSFAPDTPELLARIVARLLEKRPDSRFEDGQTLLDALRPLGVVERPESLQPTLSIDLNSLRRRQPVRPKRAADLTPTPAGSPSESWGGRRKSGPWAWVAAGMGLALVLVAGFAFWPRDQPAPPAPKVTPVSIESTTGLMRLVPGVAGDALYVDETEVLNGAYQDFCAATGRPSPSAPETDRRLPVADVSFADAFDYCQWAKKRMLTEEEWMRAAAAGEGPYPWGVGLPGPELANTRGDADGYDGPSPAGSFPAGASRYGLLDLTGNVWEMTITPYEPNEQDLADWAGVPAAQEGAWIVIKGGAYDRPADDADLRSDSRRGFPGRHRFRTVGFRCARDASSQSPEKSVQ